MLVERSPTPSPLFWLCAELPIRWPANCSASGPWLALRTANPSGIWSGKPKPMIECAAIAGVVSVRSECRKKSLKRRLSLREDVK